MSKEAREGASGGAGGGSATPGPLETALRADAGAEPLRPVWPHVRQRLHRQARFDLSFAFGAGLAVTAGLFLGVLLGTTVSTSDPASGDAGVAQSGTEVGLSSWVSLGSALPDVYGLSSQADGS